MQNTPHPPPLQEQVSTTGNQSNKKRRGSLFFAIWAAVGVVAIIGLAVFGHLSHSFYTEITQSPESAMEQSKKLCSETMERCFAGDKQRFFEAIHGSGTAKSVKVHDVSISGSKDHPIFAISIAIYWTNANVTNGFTELILYKSLEDFTGVTLQSTNGTLRDDWEPSLTDFLKGSMKAR